VQPAPGAFVEDYDYARSANPTRTALERALGELEGALGSCFDAVQGPWKEGCPHDP
jgi:cystathionine gamma-synthase